MYFLNHFKGPSVHFKPRPWACKVFNNIPAKGWRQQIASVCRSFIVALRNNLFHWELKKGSYISQRAGATQVWHCCPCGIANPLQPILTCFNWSKQHFAHGPQQYWHHPAIILHSSIVQIFTKHGTGISNKLLIAYNKKRCIEFRHEGKKTVTVSIISFHCDPSDHNNKDYSASATSQT